MAHNNWCGKECSVCTEVCELDESIPCSPDCPSIKSTEAGFLVISNDCLICDSYLMNQEMFTAE